MVQANQRTGRQVTDDDEPVCTVPQMLSVPQVASRLSVSVRKVYMLVEAGDLTLVKLGRNSRISSADVNALLDRSRAQTEPTSAPNEAPDAPTTPEEDPQ